MANYAIIGCGYTGSIHAENLCSLPNAKVTACYDIDLLRANAMHISTGATVYDSVEALCSASDVDAVLITTPNNAHLMPALIAAQHKKHIFCEKPIALSEADTQNMITEAAKNNVLFFSGHVSRFIKGVQSARTLLQSGAIGDLLITEAVHTDWAMPQPTVGWKQLKKISGGHLYHHMHEVDIICAFAGEPLSVYGMGANLAHFTDGCGDEDDAMMLSMLLPYKHMANLTIGSAFHLGDHFIKLQGSSGSIIMDFKNSLVRLETSSTPMEMSMHENESENEERRLGYMTAKQDAGKAFGKPGMKTSQWMQSIFLKEIQYFDSLVNGGEVLSAYKDLTDGSAALSCVRVLDAATASISCGNKVNIKEAKK